MDKLNNNNTTSLKWRHHCHQWKLQFWIVPLELGRLLAKKNKKFYSFESREFNIQQKKKKKCIENTKSYVAYL